MPATPSRQKSVRESRAIRTFGAPGAVTGTCAFAWRSSVDSAGTVTESAPFALEETEADPSSAAQPAEGVEVVTETVADAVSS